MDASLFSLKLPATSFFLHLILIFVEAADINLYLRSLCVRPLFQTNLKIVLSTSTDQQFHFVTAILVRNLELLLAWLKLAWIELLLAWLELLLAWLKLEAFLGSSFGSPNSICFFNHHSCSFSDFSAPLSTICLCYIFSCFYRAHMKQILWRSRPESSI